MDPWVSTGEGCRLLQCPFCSRQYLWNSPVSLPLTAPHPCPQVPLLLQSAQTTELQPAFHLRTSSHLPVFWGTRKSKGHGKASAVGSLCETQIAFLEVSLPRTATPPALRAVCGEKTGCELLLQPVLGREEGTGWCRLQTWMSPHSSPPAQEQKHLPLTVPSLTH